MMKHSCWRSWNAATMALAVSFCSAGCKVYQVGAPSLYRFDVRTVHVAIFESDSYRRFLGQRLTEAVAKEIELNTPYRLADAATADSFIRGRIVRDSKRVLAETRNDDPRALQVGWRVEVTWTDRAGYPLTQLESLRIDRDAVFIPEAGQSMTTAQQQIIDRIARQIVQQMESPW